jgi:hypothetical protein
MWRISNGLILVLLINQPYFVFARELTDPTRPLEIETETVEDRQVKPVLPRLGFVLIASDRRIAIIDGRRYEKDDYIDSYRVASISEDRVTLVDGSKKIELRLTSTRIKEQ